MRPAPMLAQSLHGEPPRGSTFEPKLDGIRVMVHKEGGDTSIYTRTMRDQSGKLPHLEAALSKVDFDFTLDGEVIDPTAWVEIMGERVPASSFSGVQGVIGSGKTRASTSRTKVSFMAFDCLSAQGKDLTDLPDVLRRGAAELVVDVLRVHTPYAFLAPRWQESDARGVYLYPQLFADVVEAGGEGLMVKNPLAAYRPGKRPPNTWSKIKAVQTADVVIMGYKPGEGRYRGLVGSIEFGQYVGGTLVPRSRCSGMTDAQRRHFSDHKQEYLNRVMEVKFNSRVGPKGSFRFPQYVRMRDDKVPEECRWD